LIFVLDFAAWLQPHSAITICVWLGSRKQSSTKPDTVQLVLAVWKELRLNRPEQVHVFHEALVEVVHVELQVHQRSLSRLQLIAFFDSKLILDVEHDVLEAPPVSDFAVPQDLGAAVSFIPIISLNSSLLCLI